MNLRERAILSISKFLGISLRFEPDSPSLTDIQPAQDASSTSNGNIGEVRTLVKKIGLRDGDVSNTDFEDQEFNLTSIRMGYDSDGYVRQSVDKYVDQIFKEGWTIEGKNAQAVEYIELRLSYMAEVTNQPTALFLQEMAEDFVKYGNTIMVKSRAKDPATLPPGASIVGINDMDPVAGYFFLNVTTMKVKRDKNGTVKGWQQEIEGADKPVTFRPDDILHFYYKREKGRAFGTSFLIPMLEDVLAFRRMEDAVGKMIHKHVNPLHHVKVGTESHPGTDDEVAVVKSQIDNMATDGGVTTTDRVEIKQVESNKVIDAEPYLKHSESRVMTDSGIPETLFGRGGTSNRNTADSMSSEMGDRIKAIQVTLSEYVNFHIIKDLLIEGGYDPITNKDDMVYLKFHDNDLDSRVKAETHSIYKFEHNAITEDEMREEIGKDPIADPSTMAYVLHGDYTQGNEIEKIKAKPTATGGGSTGSAPKTAKKAETNNKQKPTNQHGTKTSPKKSTNTRTGSIVTGMITDVFWLEKEYFVEQSKDAFSFDSLSAQIEYVIDSFITVPVDKQEIKDFINKVTNEVSDAITQEPSLDTITEEFFNDTCFILQSRINDVIAQYL